MDHILIRPVALALLLAAAAFAQQVKAGPYANAGTGGSVFGTATATTSSIDLFTPASGGGGGYRVRLSGDITKVRFFVWDSTAVSAVYFTLWRYTSGTTYSRVAISPNLGRVFSQEVNTFTLATPIAAQAGDYMGLRVEYTTPHASALNTLSAESINDGWSPSTPSAVYYQYDAASPTTLNTAAMSTAAYSPVIETWMTRPDVVLIGDSILAHFDAWQNWAVGAPNLTANGMAGALAAVYHGTGLIENMGVGGQETTAIVGRFAVDAVNENPLYVVIEGGVNDVYFNHTAQTVTNWTAMLSAASSAGIAPIGILILPWTNGTNGNMATIDSLNAQLITAIQSAGGQVVDARCAVGKFRAGGATGNCWDIQPQYLLNDGLGVHLNYAGQQVVAGLISFPAVAASSANGTLALSGATVMH